MRQVSVTLALTALLFCCGCLPQSVHPLYSPDEFFYEPQLEGYWAPENQDDLWTFTPLGGVQYDVTYYEADSSSGVSMVGQLAQIGEETWLDLYPREQGGQNTLWSFTHVPVHTFWKIELDGDKLEFIGIDPDWWSDYLKAHPDELSCENQQDGPDGWPLVTASTDKLRAFIERHHGDEKFFTDQAELLRVQPAGPATPAPAGS